MSEFNGQSLPVFKITINRETDDMGSCEKFIITPENFMLRPGLDQTIASVNNPLTGTVVRVNAQYIKCAVPSCSNYLDKARTEFAGVSHFSFPEDPQLRKAWVDIIGPSARLDVETAKVCSEHFLMADMYNMESGGRALRLEAVPCRKLGYPIQKQNSSASTITVQPAEVSWSNSTQSQGDFLPKIASVQSMASSITRRVNTSSNPRGRCTTRGRRSSYITKLIAHNTTPDPEKGLINIPASIKIPPKKVVVDLADDASPSTESAETSSGQNSRLNGGSLADKVNLTTRKKRSRRSCSDDEDEWLPPEPRMKPRGKRGFIDQSSDDDDEDLVSDDCNSRSSSGKVKLRNIIRPKGEHPLSKASLLGDWSFFKSLLPYMRKMNSAQRDSLKTFILDSLNAKVYQDNPSLST